MVRGNCTTTGIGGNPGDRSLAFSFGLAGANPFHSRTALTYTLPERAAVRIDVYSVTGQRVATLVNRVQESGVHTVPFDLTHSEGRRIGAGVYLVKISAGRDQGHLRVVAFQ